MTVYEMITGTHPYPETNNPLEINEMLRTRSSPSLEGFSGISHEVIDFVNKWYFSHYECH